MGLLQFVKYSNHKGFSTQSRSGLSWLLCIAIVLLFQFEISGKALGLERDQHLLNEVYENLKRVVGDRQVQWPNISVLGVPNRIGSYVAKENHIYVDQQAINVCREFGHRTKAALAFIIGHELTHFYQKHEWGTSGFVSHFMVSVEDFRQNREHERQADVFGGFIAQQAGYRTLEIASDLLDRLYTDYGISKRQDAKYPSLAERKLLLGESCEIAGDLINVYQSANYLLVSGHFEEAFILYDYVSRSIKFKELFNNMGVASLSSYLQLAQNPLQYPLEIDTKIPIERNTLYRTQEDMIAAAEKCFHLSYTYDKSYTDAAVHLVASLGLNQKFAQAIQLSQQLERGKLTTHQRAKLKLILGNLHFHRNQKDKAKSLLQEALKLSRNPGLSKMIRGNLQSVRRGKSMAGKSSFMPVQMIKGRTDEVDIATFESYLREIAIKPDCRFKTVQLRHSTLSRLEVRGKKLRVQRIHSPQLRKEQVGIGSSLHDLNQHYPEIDFQSINFHEGYYLISIKHGLIFKLGKDGIIQEWAIFML